MKIWQTGRYLNKLLNVLNRKTKINMKLKM